MTRCLAAAVSVGLLLVPACAQPPEGEDPSGPLATPGAPAGIGVAPDLTVGDALGDTLQELFGVVTPFLLPDRRLVVPLAEAGMIRVFGPDGAFRRSLGRRGEGPGEFTGLAAAWARGDTIEAYDRDLVRITRFPPGGPPEVVPLQGPRIVAVVPGPLADGWLLVAIPGGGPSGRDRMVYHRFGFDGAHLGELAELEGMHRVATPGATGPDPLSPMARAAVAGGRVYLAETLTSVVTVVEADGARREVAWEPGPSMPAEAAFRIITDSAAARVERGALPAVLGDLDAFPVRDRVPSFWDLRVDEEGFVWVQPFVPGKHSMALGAAGGDGEWWIVAPDGGRVGAVTVPEGLQPTWIGSDALVGIHRDGLGVETVRVHRVRRR